MRKPLIATLAIIFIICAVMVFIMSWNLRTCRKNAGILGSDLAAACDSLVEAREVLQSQNEKLAYEKELFREIGISDPVRRLRSDLMAHKELIPFEGVLGGVMGFYRAQDIRILNSSWVFAKFEDGHITGSCLLEYHIAPDTIIHWQLIKAKLDE